MEKYDDFCRRILKLNENCFLDKKFTVNDNLKNKVGLNRLFNPFYGDTTVFNIQKNTKKYLDTFCDKIYGDCSIFFGERLNPDTFHITLHDLSNSNDLNCISNELFNNEINLIDCLKNYNDESDNINFKSGKVINMVNTSLVLTVLPSTEEDYLKLCKLYELVDNVKNLPYLFTPHITLAYFSLEKKEENDIDRINGIIKEFNEIQFNIAVNTSELYYQKFTSMNSYHNIFPLIKR